MHTGTGTGTAMPAARSPVRPTALQRRRVPWPFDHTSLLCPSVDAMAIGNATPPYVPTIATLPPPEWYVRTYVPRVRDATRRTLSPPAFRTDDIYGSLFFLPLALQGCYTGGQWRRRRRLLADGPGSYPPRCTSKCGDCSPCYPVHVAVPPGVPVTTEYYPEAWRCKCGNRLYMP